MTYTPHVHRKFWMSLRLAVLIIGLPLAVFYLMTVLYVAERMGGTGEQYADCGIVFGAAVHPIRNGSGSVTGLTAGPGIARRVSTAAELFDQGRLHRLFFTGGRGEGNSKSEARVMQQYAVSLGVPAGRITLEENSRSTWENLLYTRSLTEDCRSTLAISDGYHLARIRLIAGIQGWDLPTYPADHPPSILFTARSLLREAIGVDLLVFSGLSR